MSSKKTSKLYTIQRDYYFYALYKLHSIKCPKQYSKKEKEIKNIQLFIAISTRTNAPQIKCI